MMRASHQPLAHLVDDTAEKWLAAEQASQIERQRLQMEIIRAFPLGERTELTFHGARFLLSIFSDTNGERIKVHRIAQPG